MNTNQDNKLSMWRVLQDFLTENAAITDKLPGYNVWFGKLADSIDNVMKTTQMQIAQVKGVTERKNKLEEDLMLKLLELSGKVRAYAVMSGNLVLEGRFKVSRRQLRNLPDAILIAKAQGLVNNATEVQAEAAEYGVSAELLDQTQELTDMYAHAMPQPRAGIDERKQQTRAMAVVFSEGDEAVKVIDVLVRIMEYTDPGFYSGYKSVRKIINKSRRTRALQLWVKDSARGKPVEKAKVYFRTADGEALLKKPKSTGKSGSVIFRHMAPGEYFYEVMMGGFVTETGKFVINAREMTRVAVVLRAVKNAV
jgi:hypothetical protein